MTTKNQQAHSPTGPNESPSVPQHRRSRLRRLCRRLLPWSILVFSIWLVIAYLAIPDWWKVHEAKHPALRNAPRLTTTADGIPGDPLNLFVIGTQEQLVSAMLASGWHPADPITLATSIRIVESSVFHRSYEDAPVSNLYLFARKEDFAFEKPVGKDPRQRHHVRFWQAAETDPTGRPAWWGAITFDHSVGFSHTTGQVTHHIASDVDAERDGLINDLQQASRLAARSLEPGFQTHQGENGGGDPWTSDGQLVCR